MRKTMYIALILLLDLTLPGCYGDLADVMKSQDNLLKKTLVLFALPTSGSSGGSSSGGITPPPASGPSISQYGITWTFDKEYDYGQFVNGDYWVIGTPDVKIVKITPESKAILGTTTTSGFTPGSGPNVTIRIMNGSIKNPMPGDTQGFDNEMYAWHPSGRNYTPSYNASNNIALNVSASNPLVLSAGTSLVSSISRLAGGTPQLTDAAVLTVLSSAPAPGSFRPPYCGTNKTIKYNISNMIDLNTLPEFSLTGISDLWSGSGSGSKIASMIKRVWLDHFVHISDGTKYTSPINNMPSYGREYETFISEVSLLLMSSNSQLSSKYGITKRDLAIGLCQVAIDLYAVLENDGYWFCNGGLNTGRKWPILFAGVLLNDSTMKNIANYNFTQVYVDNHGWITNPFAEDQTIFYVSQKQYDATHVQYWGNTSHSPYVGPDTRATAIAYQTSDFGMPEWGITDQPDPEHDNKNWDATYRDENGSGKAGIILAAMMLENSLSTKTLWNNNAIFDYMDRYMSLYDKGIYQRQRSKFSETMWDTYRDQIGTCYTSVSNGVRQYGSCSAAGVVK